MSEPFSSHSSYPVVQFLVRRGHTIAFALSAFVFLGFLGMSFQLGQLWPSFVGFVLAAVLLGLLVSYVEVLRIIADTLLPKY